MTLRLLRLPDVCAKFGLRTTTIYDRIKKGTLPPSIAITTSRRAWLEHELDAVVGALISGLSDEEIRALVRDLVAQRRAAVSALPHRKRA